MHTEAGIADMLPPDEGDSKWQGETWGGEATSDTVERSFEAEYQAFNNVLDEKLHERALAQAETARRQLLMWATTGAELYGNWFGQKQLVEKWMGQAAFDNDNKCFHLKEIDGCVVASDITEGIRMAKSSGFDAAECREAIMSKCEPCRLEDQHMGDKAIMTRRTDTEGAVYWCQKKELLGVARARTRRAAVGQRVQGALCAGLGDELHDC